MGVKEQIYQGIIEGELDTVVEGTQSALDEGVAAKEILDDAMIPAMGEVGRLFEANEYYVPELLIAARAMKGGLGLLKPELVATGVEPKGRVAIGTVKGDLHDIGKNLVAIMIEGAGFEVLDLEVDVSPEQFVKAVAEDNVDIIGMSALLTTTMPNMQKTIEALEEANLRDQVKVIVGGAPVTEKYANEIGADGYSRDAASAANLVKRLLNVS